jgi:hypothetical protein
VADVWAAEVAADDVRLALTSLGDRAGFGGGLSLIEGAVHRQAVLEIGVEQLVGFSSGAWGGRERSSMSSVCRLSQ